MPSVGPGGRPLRLLLAGAVLLLAGGAQAQFLRVGPFDFDAVVRTEAIYTTNVDNERESKATAEREDYYVVLALDLSSSANLSARTTADIDAGAAVEKHFNRTDLDNSDNPLGRIHGRTSTEMAHFILGTYAGIERSSSSATSTSGGKTFFPGSSSKTRRESTETEYGASLDWERDPFRVGYGYGFTRERFSKEAFQEGDRDETELDFEAEVSLRKDLQISYTHEKDRTELVNNPSAPSDWKTTESIDLKWQLDFWRHPRLTYSLGVEKEDTDTKKGEWELIHTFTARDEYDFSRTLHLSFGAMYELEDREEDNDVSLTYDAKLEHELGRTTRHSISLVREPVDTFGSTKDTDRTELTYDLAKEDLFLYGLDFAARVQHTTNKPLDPDVEEESSVLYELSLVNRVSISRRLSRSLMYEYSREDSDLEDEILDEHRVTLQYDYEL